MIFAIGCDGDNLQSSVSKRFGHAEFYLVHNSETNLTEAIKNVDENHSHQILRELIKMSVEVFIAGNIGPHAFEILNSEKTKVFLARNMTAEQAIHKFTKGELIELLEPTVKKSIDHHD